MGTSSSKASNSKIPPSIEGVDYLPYGNSELKVLNNCWKTLSKNDKGILGPDFIQHLSINCEDGAEALQMRIFHMFHQWPLSYPSCPSCTDIPIFSISSRTNIDSKLATTSSNTSNLDISSDAASSATTTRDSVSLHSFVTSIANLTRSSPSNRLKILWELAKVEEDNVDAGSMSMDNLSTLFEFALILSLHASTSEGAGICIDKKHCSRLAKAVVRYTQKFNRGKEGTENVSFAEFCEWSQSQLPMLHVCVSCFFNSRFSSRNTTQTEEGPSFSPCSDMVVLPYPIDDQLNRLHGSECANGKSGSALFETMAEFQSALFGVCVQSPCLNGSWRRLYTSAVDGLSFNRLARAVCGYQGPNVVLLQDASGGVFGVYASSGWKAANQHTGGDHSNFLFRLKPHFAIISPKGSTDAHFQYLNLNGFTLPHGIGVGGERCDTVSNFRLFLPEEDLDQCRCRSSCTTFESGGLSLEAEEKAKRGEPPTFELVTAELWGVGGVTALLEAASSQSLARSVEDANIQKARKVDKAAFVDSAFDRSMFLGKTFGAGADSSRC